jgi:hypothetical protein
MRALIEVELTDLDVAKLEAELRRGLISDLTVIDSEFSDLPMMQVYRQALEPKIKMPIKRKKSITRYKLYKH